MVGLTPEAETTSLTARKRGGVEAVEEEVKDQDRVAKKARMEDSELTRRIKKYLEENRSQRFVDIEKMTLSLHAGYPDYGRKKQAVFKIQVDKAFKELKESLVSAKKKRSQGEQQRKAPAVTEEQEAEELETAVGGATMNSRLSSLYSAPAKDPEDALVLGEGKEVEEDVEQLTVEEQGEQNVQANGAGEAVKEIEFEVIEVQDLEEEGVEEVEKEAAKEAAPEQVVETEYDRIKKRAQASAQRMKETPTRLTTPKRKPSKSLGSFMSAEKTVAAKKKDDSRDDDCEVISDDNDKDPQPAKDASRSSTSSSASSSMTSGQKSARKGRLSAAIGRKIAEEEQEVSTGPERPRLKRKLETPGPKTKRRMEVAPEMSKITFSDFGGNDSVVGQVCKLLVHLKHPSVYRRLGVTPPQGFLLHGPPGCGKTLLAHAIAGELKLPFIKVAAPELVSGVSGDSEGRIRELFEQAAASSPCVLFIDEIDCITAKREAAGKQMEGRMVAQLLACLDTLGQNTESQVVVIGATNRLEALDPALRRAGRFDREIALGIPDRGARERILAVVCRDLRLAPDTDLGRLAMLSPGYVGADLTSLAREAAMAAVNRCLGAAIPGQEESLGLLLSWLRGEGPGIGEQELEELYIQETDWGEALKVVQPSAKREGFATVPGVTWADVGALGRVREELQLSILAPISHSAQFSGLGLPTSSGVLLVGPPGCGKTLVAKAIANEAGINFISVKGPELLNMYVGESERAVRGVFQRAKNSAPCVIFFDEVDSLCPRRSSGSSDGGSSSRVVNQLLTELDGVEGRRGVWVMAATNRPDILDPAVLRPGRLDKTLYVGFPGARDRVEILGALTKGGTRPALGPGVTLGALGEDVRCEGFSGADLGNLVREASMGALREAIRRADSSEALRVEARHFERAFLTVRPSVGARDRDRYEALRLKYGHNRPEDTIEEGKVGDDILENTEELPVLGSPEDITISEVTKARSDTMEQEEPEGVAKSGTEAPDEAVTEMEGITEDVVDDGVTTTEEDLVCEASEASPEAKRSGAQEPGGPPAVLGTSGDPVLGAFYSSLAAEDFSLRFLPGMEVRVKDDCQVPSVAGKPVRIRSIVAPASCTVMPEGGGEDSLVKLADLLPGLPKEGDLVASLLPGDTQQVGELLSLDESDQALVRFPGGAEALKSLALENLCKVVPDSGPGLGDTV